MITIHMDARNEREYWDAKKQEFVIVPAMKSIDLNLEHSLISISKWESKWHKPFISKEPHTEEQTLDYIKCMTINADVSDSVYENLSAEDIQKIADYIHDPMTATTVNSLSEGKGGRKIITSEVLYSWMVALQIPFECQKWHLNRLMTLISVCNENNTPPKKMSQSEIMRRNKELNAARRAKLNSKG